MDTCQTLKYLNGVNEKNLENYKADHRLSKPEMMPLSELHYAILAKQHMPTLRKIILQEEDEETIPIHIIDLKK